jgi:hypothetical protein
MDRNSGLTKTGTHAADAAVLGPVVLIMGSAPDAVRALGFARAGFDHIVAINNAWRVRPDWDYLVHAGDFPADRMPDKITPTQSIRTYDDYVPAQNLYGGFVYAGGTMAFTAAYWALARLRPRALCFVGCDMVYPASGPSHFYGAGTADPLRADVTLQSLEAKAARLQILAARDGCACVNLSDAPRSRLVFPRATPEGTALAAVAPLAFDDNAVSAALGREAELGYMVPTGDYWNHLDGIDPAELRAIDALWSTAHATARAPETDARMRAAG